MIRDKHQYAVALRALKDKQLEYDTMKEGLDLANFAPEKKLKILAPIQKAIYELAAEIAEWEEFHGTEVPEKFTFKNIGQALIAWRIGLDVSPETLAEKLGDNGSALVSYDEGRFYQGASKERMLAVAKALGLKVDVLLLLIKKEEQRLARENARANESPGPLIQTTFNEDNFSDEEEE
jgi:hypothetical protein